MSDNTMLLVLRMIDLLALGVGLAPEIRTRFDETNGRIRALVAEGRDPTPEEWSALDAETEDLFRRLQGG